jgi:phosphatidylglycerol:prolipoprotein diacylglycerol transferase
LRGDYHPDFLVHHVGLVLGVGCVTAVSRAVPQLEPWRFIAAFGAMIAGYQLLYLPAKRRVLRQASRSTLQDLLVWALPVYAATSRLFGLGFGASCDSLAICLPAVLAIARLGCFAGGCCHGKPWRHGVLYRRELLRPIRGRRSFTPGPFTGRRVFPLQLVECGFNLAMLAWVVGREVRLASPDGRALALYVLALSLFRFFTDFARGHQHRPRLGVLRESQWCALAAAMAASIVVVET